MAKRAPLASPARGRPVKKPPTKAELAKAKKAALAARQPDLLDLLTEKPKPPRKRAKKEKPGAEG